MASSKAIKKRIGSVRNTCKITRTMEMVSTAKSTKLVERRRAAAPYKEKLLEILYNNKSENVSSPYLKPASKIKKTALIVITGNSSLCGAYNSNVLRMSCEHYNKKRSDNIECDIHVIGKKGFFFLTFMKVPIKESYLNFDDKFSYSQAEELAMILMKCYREGKYDEIKIISTVYLSSARQNATILPFLPLNLEELIKKNEKTESSEKIDLKKIDLKQNNLFEPSAEQIFQEIIPLAIKTYFYNVILEAMVSEQIARRIAMKNATDAANDMLTSLLRSYNRVRQAMITQELAEIVTGADAI